VAARKPKITELEHCSSIKEYEASVVWKRKSSEILDNKECMCAICGRRRWKWLVRLKKWKRVLAFGVHHITYERAGHEDSADLLVLCRLCHNFHHDILRYRKIAPVYESYALIAETVFPYTNCKTFKPW